MPAVELLQLPVSYPNAIRVEVNGVPATCATGVTCAYAHDVALTPSVTGVSPTGSITPSSQQVIFIHWLHSQEWHAGTDVVVQL